MVTPESPQCTCDFPETGHALRCPLFLRPAPCSDPTPHGAHYSCPGITKQDRPIKRGDRVRYEFGGGAIESTVIDVVYPRGPLGPPAYGIDLPPEVRYDEQVLWVDEVTRIDDPSELATLRRLHEEATSRAASLRTALESLTTEEMLDVAYDSGGSEPPRLVEAARKVLEGEPVPPNSEAPLRWVMAEPTPNSPIGRVRSGDVRIMGPQLDIAAARAAFERFVGSIPAYVFEHHRIEITEVRDALGEMRP